MCDCFSRRPLAIIGVFVKKEPRFYQVDAYKEIIKSIGEGKRPYASMSTGSGKALLCAMLAEKCLKQGGRALILVPSSELVSQNYAEHFNYTSDKSALGICSAKLHKSQVNKQIVYATYTSFLRRRTTSGAFNILIIDEAHYCSPDPDTSYQKIIRSLLRINPAMKICGMSATCYRQDQGLLHQDSLKGKAVFTHCAYETNIPELIKQGYLSHVESISGDIEADLSGVKTKSNGDFDESQMGVKFDAIVSDAVVDMRAKFNAYTIKTALIYASTLANARKVIAEWNDPSTIRLAHGDMSNHDRNALTEWLRNGDGLRCVVNVGLFVTGFDYQKLDCVVFFVATKSLTKYVQICGRVIRAHNEKERGYVLDFGGNIERHGPIDATIPPKNKKRAGDQPRKLCLVPGCDTINLLSAKKCVNCGAEFISESEEGGYFMRTRAQVLKAKIDAETIRFEVDSVTYELAQSRKDSSKMIKQNFYAGAEDNFELIHTNYIFQGHALEAFMLGNIKNTKDFYALGAAGKTIDNALMLLVEHPHYFKRVNAVTLMPNGVGRFKNIKSVEFER